MYIYFIYYYFLKLLIKNGIYHKYIFNLINIYKKYNLNVYWGFFFKKYKYRKSYKFYPSILSYYSSVKFFLRNLFSNIKLRKEVSFLLRITAELDDFLERKGNSYKFYLDLYKKIFQYKRYYYVIFKYI